MLSVTGARCVDCGEVYPEAYGWCYRCNRAYCSGCWYMKYKETLRDAGWQDLVFCCEECQLNVET